MKIVNKTYLLIGVLVAAAVINLVLLYGQQSVAETDSYSIIKAGDIKVNAEAIAGLSTLIASGDESERKQLEEEINKIQSSIDALSTGGQINKLTVNKVPDSIQVEFQNVKTSWNDYKTAVREVENTSVFDGEATSAMNYLLGKKDELVLLTDKLEKDLNPLDRDYNRHKAISSELSESSKNIAQEILLISIGEEENAQQELHLDRQKFNIGLMKLLGISTAGYDVEKFGEKDEKLITLPRENSEALRMIDTLWEAMQPKIQIIEERALLSPEYNRAKNTMNEKKIVLYENIDALLDGWNSEIQKKEGGEQIIVQIMLGVNIIVFIIVFFMIRQSLSPLETITEALSKIKEGVYGEKIDYQSTDEVGELVNTFNTMSVTIKQKEEDARKTDVAKDEFLAMITHELKTPLVPIQGYSDILLSEHLGKLTTKQRERINIIKSSSETLLAMISDLLDAQKLELGQLRMKLEDANVKNTVGDTIESLRPLVESTNAQITSKLFDSVISHDPERIKQVVSNLIKNSINALPKSNGMIEISMKDMQDKIQISVIDNGIGIPADKQRDLFKKFYQVDATLTREKGGSGLGLAICKGIVENHGGSITVRSDANQGAEFSFTLPKQNMKKSPIGIA